MEVGHRRRHRHGHELVLEALPGGRKLALGLFLRHRRHGTGEKAVVCPLHEIGGPAKDSFRPGVGVFWSGERGKGAMDDLKAAWLELNARVDDLAAMRQQYLDFFERATQAYLVTDRGGVIEEANGAAVDLLQRRRRELRRKPLATLVPLGQR